MNRRHFVMIVPFRAGGALYPKMPYDLLVVKPSLAIANKKRSPL
jgi:hypothetical protein